MQARLRKRKVYTRSLWNLAVTNEEGRELQNKGSQMAKYFLYAAIIHGGIAAFVTFLGAFGDIIGVLPLAVARVIAGGGPGMWFTVGYVMYTIVGVVGNTRYMIGEEPKEMK